MAVNDYIEVITNSPEIEKWNDLTSLMEESIAKGRTLGVQNPLVIRKETNYKSKQIEY
jgi:hypothetical protein